MDCRLRPVGAESLLPWTWRGVVQDIAGRSSDDAPQLMIQYLQEVDLGL